MSDDSEKNTKLNALISSQVLDEKMAEFLQSLVKNKVTIIISGKHQRMASLLVEALAESIKETDDYDILHNVVSDALFEMWESAKSGKGVIATIQSDSVESTIEAMEELGTLFSSYEERSGTSYNCDIVAYYENVVDDAPYIIVSIDYLKDGSAKVTHIAEVLDDMDFTSLYAYDSESGELEETSSVSPRLSVILEDQ